MKRVLLSLAFLASVLNADYIKVGTYKKLENVKDDFKRVSEICNNHSYLYKTTDGFEIRVENVAKFDAIKQEFAIAKIEKGIARNHSFIEIATLKDLNSVDDMFKSLKKFDKLYVKSSKGFYEFRQDIKDNVDNTKKLAKMQTVYKDSWMKNTTSSNRLANIQTKATKEQIKDYSDLADGTIYANGIKIYEPKVVPMSKNVHVNEPNIPAHIVTIAKETNEATGTRVEIRKGDKIVVSGRVLEDYDGEPLYYEK